MKQLFPYYNADNPLQNTINAMSSELLIHLHAACDGSIEYYDTNGYIDTVVKFAVATIRVARLSTKYKK